ncbi:hypothetical protein CF326_g9280, partial [Tilletia indica]
DREAFPALLWSPVGGDQVHHGGPGASRMGREYQSTGTWAALSRSPALLMPDAQVVSSTVLPPVLWFSAYSRKATSQYLVPRLSFFSVTTVERWNSGTYPTC